MKDGGVGTSAPRTGHVRWCGVIVVLLICGAGGLGCGVLGAEPNRDTALRDFLAGHYDRAISAARGGVEENPRDEVWHGLLIRALLAVGRYPEVYPAMTNALEKAPRSVTLRWLAREAFSSSGHPDLAVQTVSEIPRLVSQRPWAYRNAADLVAIGRALLLSGVDPKQILDRVYATARKAAPDSREVYLASGELALDKNDFALAARQFDEGLKKFPDDPEMLYGRARAFQDSNRKEMGSAIEAALKANPRHVPSLLLLADHQIDAEEYEGAEKTLKEAREVNPASPEAWAYEAVLAHLRNDGAAEQKSRDEALRYWKTNPTVPYLIGRKLSQKYRFGEGATLQREALGFEPGFLPAKAQLANDLLRLGDDAAGWELIQQVHESDAYDVNAYNLVTLHDTMESFGTLTNEDFVVRMPAREAEIYGDRVLNLLEQARSNLVAKYSPTLTPPTIVEVFGDSKDFGVRTFGMPDNPGYLGVCFGRVITANSPAAVRAHPVNWEAVLWHEFCHVITLQLTANRMPRWLSEGISVYEERVANPAWGEHMNPRYREMILGEDFTPIAKLSAAFLSPKSPLHLQFAYYESSLVVEFLVQRFGLPKLRAILDDLREGTFITAAIEKEAAPLDAIEKDFAAFAREKALALGPGLNWDNPTPGRRGRNAGPPAPLPSPSPAGATSGTNYWRLLERAGQLMEARKWAEARAPLEELLRHYPEQTGEDSAYAMLARVHRELDQPDAEREVLQRWARVDSEATDAYLRLMEMADAAQDWTGVETNATRYLAVNPLVPAPYRFLGRAREKENDAAGAIACYRTLLLLDPANPAEVHFRLSRLMASSEPAAAKRHLLESLEDAPRNREALHLLLRMQPDGPPADPK